ncbi:Uncharacterised protein [Escherichia coli]|uniref:Uncharacterized protein n=1 Tax=Escherichia coli TaxID=562 RepID=A0A376YIV2_ECOLX|nr:Uncharacterised protein [Escherichia coli]
MALCGVGVGAEKKSVLHRYCPGQSVTGQVNVNQPGKGDDVFTEHIRLRFTGRQKNLVMTGFQGAQQRLAGKKNVAPIWRDFRISRMRCSSPARYQCN